MNQDKKEVLLFVALIFAFVFILIGLMMILRDDYSGEYLAWCKYNGNTKNLTLKEFKILKDAYLLPGGEQQKSK